MYKRQHVTLLGKTPSPKILMKAFEEVRHNLIITVPLVIEKIYKLSLIHILFSEFPTIQEIIIRLSKENPPMGSDCRNVGVEVHYTR